VNSKFTVVFDADRAESWLNPQGQFSSLDADIGYGTGNGLNNNSTGILVPGGNTLASSTQIGPGGNASQFTNPALIGSHVFPIFTQENRDTVSQVKIQGNWTEDNFAFRFGAQYVSDHEHEEQFNDQQNNDWQAYAGYGSPSGSSTGVPIPASLLTGSFSTANFIPGYNGSLPSTILKANPYAIQSYLQSLGNPLTKNIPGFNYAGKTAYAGQFQTALNPSSYQILGEDTIAAFITGAEKTQIAGMPLTINIGIRDEFTRVSSGGLGQQPLSLAVQNSDLTSYVLTSGPTSFVRTQSTYNYILPNLDVGLNVTDKLKIRMDISRTLTRPPISDLTPVLSEPVAPRVGQLTATGGNPSLQPYLSDNIVSGSQQQSINGVTLPAGVAGAGSLAQFTTSTYVNGPQADVYGAEFALQHTFWDTGFGFQFNVTVVGTNKSYDPYNLSVSGFAVTGLADSSNFVAFYDKNGFQARIAANWRNSYLDHFGQQQNGSLFGTEPTFVNSNTTVDFSTSYDITKQLSIYGEALNLTDSGYSTHGRFSNQFLDIVSYGRRFTVGAHFRY
jgi:outer membrane receptor protein involved in Fe transport